MPSFHETFSLTIADICIQYRDTMNGDSSAPESSERASKRVKIEANDGESPTAEAATSTSKLEPVTAKGEGEEPKNGKEEADDDDEDEYAAYSAAAAQAEAVAPSGDLYLDTVSFEALFGYCALDHFILSIITPADQPECPRL
jgi:hypothetical protein